MSVLIKRPWLRLTLAVVWMILSDSYSFASFVGGFIAATVVMAILPAPVVQLGRVRFGGLSGFVRWWGSVLRLFGYFLWELWLSNVLVGRLALRRHLRLTPGILAMPLTARTPGQIALLTALITLTPGTIVVDVSDDQKAMYIHVIDASDPTEALRVPHRFESMILEVIR